MPASPGADTLFDYSACGCAGGEVVTVRGASVPTYSTPAQGRRTQKVYHDTYGRAVRTELMNWDGVTPYSTTTTKYNALDRVVRVRSYASALTGEEPAADGDAYQTTTYAYDGHGRLLTSHLPGQAAGTATAYEYYADDAVKSVTDARGVRTGYEYDGRHLVKKVKYNELGVTSVSTDKAQGMTPVAAAPDVTYVYDAAGRPSLTTQKTSRHSPVNPNTVITTQAVLEKTYDGDGAVVKEEKESGVVYYLRSSVLGGQAVAEYNASGRGRRATWWRALWS